MSWRGESSINRAFSTFVGCRYDDWHGLPAGTTVDEVAGQLDEMLPGEARGLMGREHVPCTIRSGRASGLPEAIEIWIEDAAVAVLATWFPPVDPAPLLAHLGEPAARLDWTWDLIDIPDGERVYPSRGMSLRMNREQTRVVRFLGFVPCRLEWYLDERRIDPGRAS